MISTIKVHQPFSDLQGLLRQYILSKHDMYIFEINFQQKQLEKN